MDETRARARLAEERERVEQITERLRRDIAEGPNPAGEGRLRELEADLDRIAAAEHRLDDGTYGRSVESGDPIDDGRLEAVPWAERTAAEEEELRRREGTPGG